MTGMQSISGVDLLGNLRNFVMSPFSGDDGELDSSEIADIQNQYNTQRDRNRQKAGELGFDGEYRPTAVTRNDLFPGTVEELRAKVDKIDLDSVSALISAWNEISTRNSTSLDEFRKQIARGMSPDVWAGSAASSAAQTVAAYDATGKRSPPPPRSPAPNWTNSAPASNRQNASSPTSPSTAVVSTT